MQVWEGVVLAMHQIRTQKLKSFFSLLGVILGVLFLIVVVTVVEGLDRYVREDFTAQIFGVNTVTLQRSPSVNINTSEEEWRARQRRPRITYEDADAIRASLSVPARIAVESDTGGEGVGDNGRSATGMMISGASPEIFEIRNLEIARGRAFTPQEAAMGVPVVVIGSKTAEVIFESLDPLERTIRIRGFPYRIIGVLKERGSLFGQSLDNLVIAPARSPIQAVTNPRGIVDSVIIQALDPARLREAQMEVEGIMRARRGLRPGEANDFSLETADEAISFWDNISRILFIALPGLVAISLVVGGIVIMNIMLASFRERIREVGVRKAIGARGGDIAIQFLVESVLVTSIGGAIGLLAGMAFAKGISVLLGMPTVITPKMAVIGVLASVSTGLFFGLYPALRAARLNPVDALRYE